MSFFYFFSLKMGFELVLFISFLGEFGVNTVNKILDYLPELEVSAPLFFVNLLNFWW